MRASKFKKIGKLFSLVFKMVAIFKKAEELGF
jgi:hypothetical protein